MKKILIPTDFSKNARTAMEYAVDMFGHDNVKYMLLNTYENVQRTTDMLISIRDWLQKDSQSGLKREADYLLSSRPDMSLDVETHSIFGSLVGIIKSLVKKGDVDLIVMGTKGMTGLRNVLTGSNTADVVGKVETPVLVIPEDTRYRPLSRIALATDQKEFSEHYDFSALKEMLIHHEAKFFIINILTGSEELDASCSIPLHQSFKLLPHEFHHLEHRDVIVGLNQFIAEKEIDMLAMVGHRHKFFERLFIKSTTKEMSKFTHIPLLILHEKTGRDEFESSGKPSVSMIEARQNIS